MRRSAISNRCLECSRREFLSRVAGLGITISLFPAGARLSGAEPDPGPRAALTFPGPWQFQLPKSGIILVSDQQLEDLQDPDKEVDLSVSTTPQLTTLKKICEQAKAQGARTVILAFDEFWSQYRKGQGGKPRQLLPDTAAYVQRLARISQTLRPYGLGLELSLLSPLEIGKGYREQTGESGRWVQYREGYRDPATGRYVVSLWEQRRWTNNKGTIELQRAGLRVFAFREQRVGGTRFYRVAPGEIVELKTEPEVEVDQSAQASTHARRLTVRGVGETNVGPLDRVLVVVSYATPEMDYFSPRALPFLQGLVDQYHAAGVPLNGLYADEMHIQQDWGYFSHHDEGQFTFRYLTRHLAKEFAAQYGAEFEDLEKYLVYFAYGQHGFLPTLEARLAAQHVLGASPEEIHRTQLLRRRYYDLLEGTVVKLFASAKAHAEAKYGHELEARAHATWAQSPTIDAWETGASPRPPRQYDYTPDFVWSNTVHQAASACSDYFAWNDFLTGGGNDHAEGGWSDRNYYGVALACSTGILNRTPYAYAAAWGMPNEALRRHQAVCDAFGASAHPWFQAVQDCQHRDTEVLMLYPHSLVACEERFGSWMVQYGYANYVSPRKLVQHGKVTAEGRLELAGRRFGTLAVLFEPFPTPGLWELIDTFARSGGKVIWSGPPPRLNFSNQAVLGKWHELFGIQGFQFGAEGQAVNGWQIQFSGALKPVPAQMILTDFLVDLVYPVEPAAAVETVARVGSRIVGTHRSLEKGGTATFLGFRPRDDQAASLGVEVRTWFEILLALGAYAPSRPDAPQNDNPSAISRQSPYLACRFPNGALSVAAHYRTHEESWPGGFHRDEKQDREILARNPLPSATLQLRDFPIHGQRITYDGILTVAWRQGPARELLAFAGHQCRAIAIDGQPYEFASQPVGLAAWAPVLPERRLTGGALLELWIDGEAEIKVPLPEGVAAGRLHFQGAQLGSLGDVVPSQCADRLLRFAARKAWPQKHLYFVPS
jgi:hypothetical protein